MKKFFLPLILLLPLLLWGRYEVVARSACAATNDLRGSRNVGNVHLKPGSRYTVQRRYKDHYLLGWRDGTQRWVRQECMRPINKEESSAAPSMSHDEKSAVDGGMRRSLRSLLVLSWQNAFCETHAHRKECRPLSNPAADHLVLHGLWPQPRNRVYCGVPASWMAADRQHRWRGIPSFRLSPDLKRRMFRYMPGALSGLERHEWVKHGSCYDSDPARYYEDALSLTAQVDRSAVGEYLRSHKGQRVGLVALRRIFAKSFGRGMENRLAMGCRRGLLTELSISLRGKGGDLRTLLPGAEPLPSRCQSAIVDAPGHYRRH